MAKNEKKEAGYEVSDVNTTVVWIMLAIVAGMMTTAIVFTIFMMRGMDTRTSRERGLPSPLDTAQAQIPGSPRLQADPVEERKAVFKEMADKLNSYGATRAPGSVGTDEAGGMVVHIPIERAMELVGTHKVPYRQKPEDARVTQNNPSSGSDQ